MYESYLIAIITLLAIMAVILIMVLPILIQVRDELRQFNLRGPDLEDKVTYTKHVIQFVREIVAELTLVEFRNYIDSKEVEKTTLANYRELAQTIAETAYQQLRLDQLDYDSLLVTRYHLERMIIHYIINYIKDMLDQAIQKRVDETHPSEPHVSK